MKSKIVLVAGLGLAILTAKGQNLQTSYITWPDGQQLASDVAKWTPGQQLFEDENFFISRVKAKPTLKRNVATQIYETINDANDKKLLFWVPVGNTNLNGVHTDALPNGIFDSEVFSAWSYVTHYGDWTSPFGWVPGGFADAAHRHGVAVSGVASIPYGSISEGWNNCLKAMGGVDVDKLAQFLHYHGVNGLGYNSEYSATSSVQQGIQKMHAALVKAMADKDPIFENVLYDGVSDSGGLSFSECLTSTNKVNFGDSENKRASFFLNYNWNYDWRIANSRNTCSELGRSMKDLYAGMNMQGGNKTATEWINLQTVEYSIGLWGAHDFNYLWSGRSKNGSSDDMKQRTYQRQLEQWFTNGVRNPARKVEVYQSTSLAPTDEFFGMSRFLSARSTLGWDLAEEPFVTYFNLGNGKFFNYEGVRQHDKQWYNIGVQDYMPTWRFWFADKFLGKEPANVPAEGLDAEFVWDEAYFGGSSLRVAGSTDSEYLHLFRTSFKLERNDVITVRYKIISGSGNMNLALSVEGSEDKTIRETESFKVFTTEQEADDEVWVEKTFTISGPIVSSFNVNPLAMIALHFTDAKNLDIRLGEISIRRGTAVTPDAPQITLAKVLANNYSGIDAKVVFNMANNLEADGKPCYNSDVNTSLFTLWAQQKGEEPVMMGATSSWAAMFYQVPVNADGTQEVRFGIQAVSMDRKSTSEISWSDYLPTGDYAMSEAIQNSKSTIKPGEPFVISFVDPMHGSAQWSIRDRADKEVASAEGTEIAVNGLDELGSYDVVVTSNGQSTRYNYYLLVSAWDKGALPEITKLTVDGTEAAGEEVSISPATDILLGYEGRGADGASSRAVGIEERFVGLSFPFSEKDGDTVVKPGIDAFESFGAAAWVNMKYPQGSSSLFQVENRGLAWPTNNWGWCWFDVEKDGKLGVRFRGNGKEMGYYYDNANVPAGAWTHVAFSFEYEGSSFRFRLFINGEELMPYLYGSAAGGGGVPTGSDMNTGADGKYDLWINNRYSVSVGDWLSWGGGRGSEPNYNNGQVDDMVIWKGAITPDDARKAMEGFDENNLPENVLAFWSFENEPVDNAFLSKGQRTDLQAVNFDLLPTGEEGKGVQYATPPVISAGCPTLDSQSFKVVTTPTWTAKRGVVSEAKGSDKEGSAKVNYTKNGDYTVTLTLENVLGSDSKTYPVLRAASSAIEGVEADGEVSAYTVDDAVIVEFPADGDYTVAVYDVEGKLVAQRSQNVQAGEAMTVALNASGVYVVNVVKDGQVVRNVKLIKK